MISFSLSLISRGTAAGLMLAAVLAAQQTSAPENNLLASAKNTPTANPTGSPTVITPELRGDIYMARKMYREAIDMYREGPADSPVLANKIGIAFHQMLQLDLAKKNYQRAMKLNPKYSEAINNLGTVYYAQKSYGRAIGLYKRALRYSEPSASVYANLGAAYFARKDFKDAMQWYQGALQLDPDVFEHHSTFGTLMQERTVDERATFHLYLAKMYAKSGNNDRALIYLRKALEEGVKGRDKISTMPEFAVLKTSPAFKQLMLENPKPL
jgi:tetratricopeptide (TPR) repeat protein